MTYKKALQESLTVEWKISLCPQGEVCWCRVIEPKNPITYQDGELLSELYIVGSGNIHKEVAEHLVRIHNIFIQNK